MCKGRWSALFLFVFVLLLVLPVEKSLAQSEVQLNSKNLFTSFDELVPTAFAIVNDQKVDSAPLGIITFENVTASGCQKTIQFELDEVFEQILPGLTCSGEYTEHSVNRRSDDDSPADQRGLFVQFGYGEAKCTLATAQGNHGEESFAISITYELNETLAAVTGCNIPVPIIVSTDIVNSDSGSRSTGGLSTIFNIGFEFTW